MAITDDFSFPAIAGAGESISQLSTTLWRISSSVSPGNDDDDGGGTVMSDLEAAEEKMDSLWEDLNEELGDDCNYGVGSSRNYSPVGGGGCGSASEEAAKGCKAVVAIEAFGKLNGAASSKRPRVVAVLKKLLLLHSVVQKLRRK